MKIKTIQFSDLSYEKPCKDNKYTSHICMKKDDFYIQLDKLVVRNVTKESDVYHVDLLLTKKYLEFFLKLEKHNIDTCYTNSKEWFGKQMSLNTIETNYNSILTRIDLDNTKIILSIPSNVSVYDSKKEKKCIEDVVAGTKISCILKMNYLKFGKTSIYMDYSVEQVKYYIKEVIEEKYLFLESDSDNESSIDDVEDDNELEQMEEFIKNKMKEF